MPSRSSFMLEKFRSESQRRLNGLKTYTDDGKVERRNTKLEKDIFDNVDNAETLLIDLPPETFTISSQDVPAMKLFVPQIIEAAVFCGHVVTDLDSVAGSIGAAALYGGVAATASEINSETDFALKRFGCEIPRRIEELLAENPDAKVCLVDHQQTSQMNPAIPSKNVCGIIDHHALQNKTVVTDKPIYVDIRPWGSMSTIIGHSFLTQKKRPSKAIAGVLLCAILSDTLNLLSPTTTDWDKILVAVLADIAEIEDIDSLAVKQFQAKSRQLANLSAYSLVHGDQKTFSFHVEQGFQGDLGFAVIETTDDDVILKRVEELVVEMVACKKENSMDLLFLAVVNIVKLQSQLVLCGPAETSLAERAYGGNISAGGILMDLGNRVSRKSEFIPVLASTIQSGWNHSGVRWHGLESLKEEELGYLDIQQTDPYGQIHRLGSSLLLRSSSEFLKLEQ
ncbi:inorganic diphosphatase [Nitzschia inconspicua]|uniref:Inorganic diphosphatase n=1 Tax=Nitzschia inconspicua TaxID=303405 RepID=A0A9K3PHX5_9STRA|nr:inorganic diphosphatase [Nitzschia inconspicua]